MVKVIMVTAPEAEVRVESPVRWRVLFRVESQMPLAHDVRAVSEFSKIFRQKFLVKR